MTTAGLVLATDLDGTLIPLADHGKNQSDLNRLGQLLRQQQIPLIYVTGRHYESVQHAVRTYHLPPADWIICDVGTTVYARQKSGMFLRDDSYAALLTDIVQAVTRDQLMSLAAEVPGLELQEAVKQAPFKLSYYVASDKLQQAATGLSDCFSDQKLPFAVISSVDPFSGTGLIDILPAGVSKAFALKWWCDRHELPHDQIIFSGDSGNDLAAFTAGYRAVLVANTPREIAVEVHQRHQQQGWNSRMYCSVESATSGVLEGLLHFLEHND